MKLLYLNYNDAQILCVFERKNVFTFFIKFKSYSIINARRETKMSFNLGRMEYNLLYSDYDIHSIS